MCEQCDQSQQAFIPEMLAAMFGVGPKSPEQRMDEQLKTAKSALGAFILMEAEQEAAQELGAEADEVSDSASAWNAKLYPYTDEFVSIAEQGMERLIDQVKQEAKDFLVQRMGQAEQ